MSKLWKRSQPFTRGDEIAYIDNEFLISVGSFAKCGEPNCNRSTEKIRRLDHIKLNPSPFGKDVVTVMWRCEICTAEGKGWTARPESATFVANDSTFSCPSSKCTAVNQSFQDFVDCLCCKENQRQKREFEKYETMRIRDVEYQSAYKAKMEMKRKIEREKQSAKKAREGIEEYQQKLKDAERNVKIYENKFVELQKEVDTKKRQLEEEIVVVATPQQLAIEANHEDAVEENNNTTTTSAAVSAIKTEASTSS